MLNWDSYNLESDEGVDSLLRDLGHLRDGVDRTDAIKSYQDYSGLKETGVWSGVEESRLYERSCRCPDISNAETRKGHWEFVDGEKQVLRIYSVIRGAGEAFAKLLMQGAKWWSKNAQLDFVFVDSFADCDIWATFQRIDGRGRTLAWSMLPQAHLRPGTRRLEQRYDSADMTNEAGIVRVSAHEIGHAIGIDHIPASLGTALMNPFDNPNIRKTQPLDDQEAIERYGKRADEEPTDPSDPGEPADDCEIYRAKIERFRTAKENIADGLAELDAAEEELFDDPLRPIKS